jgi:hypothetical protein
LNLRAEARGRDCQIRLECCNGDPNTVVLAHFRLAGLSGMGFKSPDFIGAWACSACHQRVDTDKSPEVQLDFAKGCFRTQAQLLRELDLTK